MFRIADGREHFYQWDLDRQVVVNDPSIVEVHFCNRTEDVSLVVEVVDGLANVPNILLQSSFDMRVFGYDGKATRHDAVFKVKAKTKPSDYVYTETEIKNYNDLVQRATEAVEQAEESATQAKDSADSATATATDLYEFVEGHKLILTDDNEGNVRFEAAEKGEGAADLTNYYTKEETDSKIEEAINDIPEPDLSDYALKSDIPNIPENVSAFNNDAGYLTQHQSLAAYALKSEVPDVSAFKTESQVNALISAALSNIGVAEEGAY